MFRRDQPVHRTLRRSIGMLLVGLFVVSIVRNGNEAKDSAFATARNPQDSASSEIDQSPHLTGSGVPAKVLGSNQAGGTSKNAAEWAATSTETKRSVLSIFRRTIEPGAKLTSLPATNPQGLAVQYSVIRGAFPGTVLLASNGEFSGTEFTSGLSATEVQATDRLGRISTLTVEVEVRNISPRFSSASSNSKQNLMVGETPLAVTAIDPNKEQLTFTTNVGTMPPGLSLGTDGLFNGKALEIGEYSFGVLVSDEHGFRISTTLQLVVGPPRAASAQPSPQGSFDSVASDPKEFSATPVPTIPEPPASQSSAPKSTSTSTSVAITEIVQRPLDSELHVASPIPPTIPGQPVLASTSSAIPPVNPQIEPEVVGTRSRLDDASAINPGLNLHDAP